MPSTGARVWKWVGPAPSDSAAAVSGPSGKAVVAVTDLAGNFDVLRSRPAPCCTSTRPAGTR